MNAPCSTPVSTSNLAPTMLPVLPVVAADLPHLPASRAEMNARAWDYVDVVFVTGDAYVDHPAFAMGILSRVLEAAGFRVAILSQPDWQSCRALAAVRPAAALLRHQRRQHGQHDQPLHGEQKGPQRRRLFARRPDWPAARSRDDSLLPAAARRFPACRSSPVASRPRSAGWPITTTGATPSAARSCSTPRPIWSSSAWASTRSSRSPAGWPRVKLSRI